MTDPAQSFARATYDVLMVMHDRQLPAPLSLHWSPYLNHLSLQVQPGDFLRWLDALTESYRTAHVREGQTHHRASGKLRGAPEVAIDLTTVTKPRRAVA
ncbi:hypothetical protein ACFVWG_23890 [Kribbella sp. NPDC058245]|uniref:hypothetical protein n=1 Tax=Kribbella sp. NPDC058245 TaxID=3346399 RepID=UPI0036E6E7A7